MLLALAVLTAAIAPVGFKQAPKLEPAASFVAGKPVKVWCATSKAAFAAEVQRRALEWARMGTNDALTVPTGAPVLV